MLKLPRLILAFAYLLSPGVFAIVYKCDDNGKISYQDTKCDSGVETITHVQDKSTAHSNTAQTPAIPTTNTQEPTNLSPNPATPNIPKPKIKPDENNNNSPVATSLPESN